MGALQICNKASCRSRLKIETFVKSKVSRSKYRQNKRCLPRLRVIAHDNNEIWSFDSAFVYKIDNHNNGFKYLSFTGVYYHQKTLTVQPKRTNGAELLLRLSVA